ncbi:MAG: phytoene desaturase family protein [Myxococcota bacterium]
MLDAIVVGGGHNGLACAAYLARAGRRTLVVERRSVLGGACCTEELWPGYRVSRAAYVAGLLRPRLVRELELERRGLRLLRRQPSSFTPLPDGRHLLLGAGAEADRAAIAAFSPRDARRYPAYEDLLDRTARVLEPLLDVPPPALPRLRADELAALARAAWRARRLGRDASRAAALLLGPARPVLESWFESEPLRATLGTDAVIGAWASPSTPGTGYVLFHHVMGETGGARGVWAYVEGGMGALSEALATAARDAGAEIRLEAPVASVAVREGRACGVVLEDGTHLESKVVVSNADPRHTFLSLVGEERLPPDFVGEVRALDVRSGSVKINLALEHLPRFKGRSGGSAPGPEHSGTIHVGAVDLDALDRAFDEARAGRIPSRPIVELTTPSALDPTLAPEGRHVASLFVQYAPLELAAEEGGWDAARDRLADRALSMVEEVAPGFRDSVLEREVLLPADLERVFGLAGGNIFHGAMSLDRLAFMRPLPGWARHATPIRGLFLCGAGTHPGGGVMGACGRNAAKVVLRAF